MSGGDYNVGESELQAWVDGRLSRERLGEVEAWLAEHPDEAERVAAYRDADAQLRAHFDPVLREPVPERLEVFAHAPSRWRRAAAVAGWLAIGAAVGGTAGWELRAVHAPAVATVQAEAPVIAQRAALAHATYAPEVRHPVEVGAAEEKHLVAWLSKRLGGDVRAPRLEGEGMSLVGGRLLPRDPGPVAQFMYQNAQGRRVTLYVRTEADQRETAFRFAREGGVRVFYWIDRKFGYALSSADLERDELLRLANVVYRQLNP